MAAGAQLGQGSGDGGSRPLPFPERQSLCPHFYEYVLDLFKAFKMDPYKNADAKVTLP